VFDLAWLSDSVRHVPMVPRSCQLSTGGLMTPWSGFRPVVGAVGRAVLDPVTSPLQDVRGAGAVDCNSLRSRIASVFEFRAF
jgi:hypothetical protein